MNLLLDILGEAADAEAGDGAAGDRAGARRRSRWHPS